MSNKLTTTLLAALAALSVGAAYAAGAPGDKNAAGAAGAPGAADAPAATAAPAGENGQKPLTKEEAMKQGVTAEVFKKADMNGDGLLDQREIDTYNAQHQGSKK
jgi:hypothetical protein